jgi:oligopeptide transport system substrate-binding protein
MPWACVWVGLAAVFAFSAAQAEEGPPALRVSAASPFRTCDPHATTGAHGMRLSEALFEGLTYLDPKTQTPMPGAARSWSVSRDGLTYSFEMRKEARWSDGRPVTAKDFAWSLRRALHPDTRSEYAYMLYSIKGARALNEYGALAKQVLGPNPGGLTLLQRLAMSRKEMPLGFDREIWHMFSWRDQLARLLHEAKEPLLRRIYKDPPAFFEPELVLELEQALRREATRYRREHLESLETFGHSRGVRTTKDGRLLIELEKPHPMLLRILATPIAAPLRRDVHAVLGGSELVPFSRITNGPFGLDSSSTATLIRLERSATYWGRDSIRQRIIQIRVAESPAAALRAYKQGSLDWLPYPSADQQDEWLDDPGLAREQSGTLYFMRLNCARPALRDARVRRALSLAVDRRAIKRATRRELDIPYARLVPPGMRGYPRTFTRPDRRIEEAQALLAAAGYPRGKGLPTLDLLYNTDRGHKAIAYALAGQWRVALGIQVEPRNKVWHEYLYGVHRGEYDIARAGWIPDYADPATFLEMFRTGGGNNRTGWSDAVYDKLLDDAKALTHSPDARMDRLARAEERLLDEAPIIPLYLYSSAHLISPRLQGFYMTLPGDMPGDPRLPNIEDLHPYRGMWIEQDK